MVNRLGTVTGSEGSRLLLSYIWICVNIVIFLKPIHDMNEVNQKITHHYLTVHTLSTYLLMFANHNTDTSLFLYLNINIL